MIVFLVAVAALSTWLVLAITWGSDRWEREPAALVENVLLLGVALQLACVIAARWWFGFEEWQLLGPLGVMVPVGLVIPFVARSTAEMDEPFDGIVYAVAFACGASLVMLLWDLPLIARAAAAEAMRPDALPGLSDLVSLFLMQPVLSRLSAHLGTLAVAALVGALFGRLHARTPRLSPVVLVLCTASAGAALAGFDLILLGSYYYRGALIVLAIGSAAALKAASPFRLQAAHDGPDHLAAALRTGLLVIGAAFLALCILAGTGGSDRFRTATFDNTHMPQPTGSGEARE